MLEDFDAFKWEKSFAVRSTDSVSVSEGSINTSQEFGEVFPDLNNLISKARVLHVTINNEKYNLYSWNTKTGHPCGWFCKMEEKDINELEILPEHQLLLDNIGGIKESYNEPDNSFTNNQNFLFIKTNCEPGLPWNDYYEEMCEGENIEPMPVHTLVSFVQEANGASTLYDIKTQEVYLFSHDHSFDYVTTVKGQPSYTFHHINGVKDFIDYVETLANQWNAHIK